MEVKKLVKTIEVNAKQAVDMNDLIVVLDCGHFDGTAGVDDFSINSANIAVDIYKESRYLREKGLKFVFSVLKDDVGLHCSDDGICAVDTPGSGDDGVSVIPASLKTILQEVEGFRDNKTKLFSEKTARNRGLQYFRKKLQGNDLSSRFTQKKDESKSQLFFNLSSNQPVLIADILDHAHWVGHCPLLMGMHYSDIADWASRVYSHREKIMIVDFSMIFDRGKVNAGAEVALTMNDDIVSIINVCSADEELTVCTTDIVQAP